MADVPSFSGFSRNEAVAELRDVFRKAGIEEADLDARLLTLAALGISAAKLLTHPQQRLNEHSAVRLAEYRRRRLGREPVARILGHAEFWGLAFHLSADTLVPRPDTETIVAAALGVVFDRSAPVSILDLGTGSGCILVALLHELGAASGIGLDRSAAALVTARRNAHVNGVRARALFAASDWATALSGRFDLVVSNPPYIRSGDIAALDPEVRAHDPAAALDGGSDGLGPLRSILRDLGRLLEPGGHAILEIGHDQCATATEAVQAHGFAVMDIVHDLGRRPRAVVIRVASGK